ncbi:MAG TPA: hypothetical protein VFZ34_25980 [Blastocatellia bacterium]|nr:hypothetical protein [Blastocatellia bacterium]
MRYHLFTFVFAILGSFPAFAQNAAAEQALAKMKAALGGEEQIHTIRSLSFTAAQRKLLPGKEIKTELKVEWLLPDKFYKQEKTEAQKNVVVTLTQILNGTQVWMDRQVNAPVTGDDAITNVRGQQTTTPPQIANSTIGMKDTATGTTSVRTSASNAPVTTERSVLGMSIPRPTGGKDSDNDLQVMNDETRAAKQKLPAPPPRADLNNPGIQTEMERDFRDDFQSLSLVLLPSATQAFKLTHFEVLKAAEGKFIEAIDLTGKDDYQARLFLDQSTHLPVMLSYRALRNPKGAYVATTNPADLQEVAVQLFFSDYKQVNNVRLPFRVVKAVNGIQVEEWNVEKYKLNPDLKAKKFEKK